MKRDPARGPELRSAAARLATGLIPALVTLASCGDGSDRGPAPPAGPADAGPTVDAGPGPDSAPPAFLGIQAVELVGTETYRISWRAAIDDRSTPENIRYQIYFVREPFAVVDDSTEPSWVTDGGATELVRTFEGRGGRFYVRAVDEAGNRSPIGDGVAQRGSRPWLRASDGSVLSSLRDCVTTEPGRALCVGDEGSVLRWDRQQWVSLDSGCVEQLRISDGPGGIWLHGDNGNLIRVAPDGTLEPIAPRFMEAAPALPLRQFASDSLELLYWIDAEERVWIGPGREFYRMERPLALPESGLCATLRGIAFTDAASFAVCSDGAVYSVGAQEVGVRWMGLTATTPFPLEHGITSILATEATSALISEPGGVRHVTVGGWTTFLEAGAAPGGDPESPAPREFGRVQEVGHGRRAVPTDLGAFVERDGVWEHGGGPLLAAAGVVPPTPLEPADQTTVIYRDGSVAGVRPGGTSWKVRPRLGEFSLVGFSANRNPIALTSTGGSAVVELRGREWEVVAPVLPEVGDSVVSWDRVAMTGDATPILVGSIDEIGAIWRYAGRSWSLAPMGCLAPPPPVSLPRGVTCDEGGCTNARGESVPPPPPAPPPPLAVGRCEGDPPAPEPLLDVDVAADGRGVAVSEHQVWWRMPGGTWVLLAQRPGPISAVALDVEEAYVLQEGRAIVRCWRDRCGDGVSPPVSPPAEVAWAWHDGAGLVAVLPDGSTMRYAPATWSPIAGASPLIDPAIELPAGAWTPGGGALPADLVPRVVQRLTGPSWDQVLLDDGSLLAFAAGEWREQAQASDALQLVTVGESWAVATSRGLLTLGDVAPAGPVGP